MSKSYKKVPCVKDKNKGSKKLANRRLRRSLIDKNLLPQNSFYKRLNESYDISDYTFKVTFQEYKQWNNGNENELYQEWYRTYKAK